ncbi:hypothetical protein ACSVBT_08225 [Afipia sp. TerB]
MGRLFIAAVAAGVLVSAVSLVGGRAEAMTLPGGIAAPAQAEQVRLVCSRVWNGYAWVRSCYRTGPRYYAPGPYYAPRYYGGGLRFYDRPYYRRYNRW